jgi:hypothetical protein
MTETRWNELIMQRDALRANLARVRAERDGLQCAMDRQAEKIIRLTLATFKAGLHEWKTEAVEQRQRAEQAEVELAHVKSFMGKIAAHHLKRAEQAEARAQGVTKALENLVNRLAEVHDRHEYQAVWEALAAAREEPTR